MVVTKNNHMNENFEKSTVTQEYLKALEIPESAARHIQEIK